MVLNLPHLLANHTSIASQNISYIVMETGQRCVPEEQILTQVPKLSSWLNWKVQIWRWKAKIRPVVLWLQILTKADISISCSLSTPITMVYAYIDFTNLKVYVCVPKSFYFFVLHSNNQNYLCLKRITKQPIKTSHCYHRLTVENQPESHYKMQITDMWGVIDSELYIKLTSMST